MSLVACAIGFEGTLAAGAGGVVADLPLLLNGLEAKGQGLTGRAPVAVLLPVIAEVFFGEQPALAVGGGVGFGDVGIDVFLKAGLHFLPIVVAHVGDHIHLVDAQGLLGALGHAAQQPEVGDIVGDVVVDDQFVLGVDAELNVEADQGGLAAPDPELSGSVREICDWPLSFSWSWISHSSSALGLWK